MMIDAMRHKGQGIAEHILKRSTRVRPIAAALGLTLLGNVQPHSAPRATRPHKYPAESILAAGIAASPIILTDQHCRGTTRPDLTCEAISAEAALRQAKDADEQASAIWWQFGVALFTLFAAGVAAIFAGRAAFHTKRAADESALGVIEASKSAKAAEEALLSTKRQVRAYLSFEPTDVAKFEIGNRMTVPFKLSNSGATPARQVAVASAVFIRGNDWVDDTNTESPAETRPNMMIGPNLDVLIIFESSFVLTEPVWNALKNGKCTAHIRGRAEYVDCYGEHHWVTVRSRYGQAENILGRLAYAEQGNDGD